MARLSAECVDCGVSFRTNVGHVRCKRCRDYIRKRLPKSPPIQCEGCGAWHEKPRNIGINQCFCSDCLKIHSSWLASKGKPGWKFGFIRAAERARARQLKTRVDANAHIKEWEYQNLILEKPWLDKSLSPAQRQKLRRCLNPEYALGDRIRSRMRKGKYARALDHMRQSLNASYNKSGTNLERLLGYSIAELKTHLEKQFCGGMSWEQFRQGKIHIDHIQPLNTFKSEDMKHAWALSNLRPLWAEDNMARPRDGRDILL